MELSTPLQKGLKQRERPTFRLVVLAGGLGKRLGLLTKDEPKVLMKVGEMSTLHYVLDWAFDQGLGERDTALSLFHLPNKVREFVEKTYFDNYFLYDFQMENLGTAGAIKSLRKWLTPTFIVCNGDTITDVSLPQMLKHHYKYRCAVTVFTHDDAIHSGGVYIFEKDVLDLIPEEFMDINTGLIPLMIEKGLPIGLFKDEKAFYFDVGTPGGLKKARSYFNE